MGSIPRHWPALILFLPLLIVSSSAAGEERGGTLLLTVDGVPAPDAADISGRAAYAVFQTFRERHPDIRFRSSQGLVLQGPAAESALLMSIAGGTAPNAMYVNFRDSGSYVERGFLAPLDEWIRPDLTADEARAAGTYDDNIMYRDEWEARVLPAARPVVRRRGPDGRTHIYALPTSNLATCLVYNKALFQKAGLDPERDYPRTWDEFMDVARRLTDRRAGIYGFQVERGTFASWTAFTFFSSMGARAMAEDPVTGEWRCAFASEAAAVAFDFHLQLLQGPWTNPRTGLVEYGAAYTDADAWLKWNRGEIGMKFSYLDDQMLAAVNPDQIGLAPLPASPIGLRAGEINSRMLGLFAGTRDPAMRDAAWKYIRFQGGPEAQAIATRVFVENGYARFIPPERLRAAGFGEYARAFPPSWEEAFRVGFAEGVPEPFGAGAKTIYHFLSQPLETAYNEGLARNEPDPAKRRARLMVLLNTAQDEANAKMIGHVPPEIMRTRRLVALVVATVVFAAFIALLWRMARMLRPVGEGVTGAGNIGGRARLGYCLLAPAALAILVFNYFPLLRGTLIAFQDYNVMGGSRFVGLDNFAGVLFDGVFWLSLWRTLEYVLYYLALVFVPPIGLAVLLSEIPYGKIPFRVIFYLPAVMAGVVTLLLWKLFFDPSESGVANSLVGLVGLEPQTWLQSKNLAMMSLMIPPAWASLGPGCLIYLAALKTVPPDLYEAAAIDGAGFFQRLFHVALPSIRALILIQFLFAVISAFQSADNVLIMTGGGPDRATNVIGLEIFYNAYVYLRFGAATAMGWILGFLLVWFAAYQVGRMSRMTFTTAGR